MSPIFAQVMVQQPQLSPVAIFMLALLGMATLVILVFVPGLFMARVFQRRREWEHAERMRALDMGLPVAFPDVSAWPKAIVCAVLGTGVPSLAFAFTAVAHDRPGSADALWIVPAIITGVSVVAVSILAGYLFRSRPESTTGSSGALARDGLKSAKSAFDPDAYDVAGQRG